MIKLRVEESALQAITVQVQILLKLITRPELMYLIPALRVHTAQALVVWISTLAKTVQKGTTVNIMAQRIIWCAMKVGSAKDENSHHDRSLEIQQAIQSQSIVRLEVTARVASR